MATPNLQVQIHASAHLLSFCASSRHQKPFKIEPKVFVPKIRNTFTDTHDMALRLNKLNYMTKMNIHL